MVKSDGDAEEMTSMRVRKSALEKVRIAAAIRGVPIARYASEVLDAQASRDIDEGVKRLNKASGPKIGSP